MAPVVQNLAVFTIVSACCAYVGWQILLALRGRKSKLGSCCAKGCEVASSAQPKPAAVQFLPLANLGVRKK